MSAAHAEAMPGEGRHFATVLFLDIVGSTPIAEELGDARWRSLLIQFRRVVRGELKRSAGREVDTAGDGFFATFAESTSALRAARMIAESVQSLGLDVRLGIHAGQVEHSGKQVSGLTVHVGARVMALAGPAQILVTSTVRDMERGGEVVFENAGEQGLKGLEGTWQIFSVTSVAGRELPTPLEDEQARVRREAVFEEHPRRLGVIAGSVVLLALLALAVAALVRSSRSSTPPPASTRPALVRVDLGSRSVAASVDEPTTGSNDEAPGSLGGQLVRVLPDRAEFRDLTTGTLLDEISLPSRWDLASVGGQAIWLGTRAGFSTEHWLRFDQRTGAQTADVVVPEGLFDTLRWGAGGGWFITGTLSLGNLDPTSLGLRTFPTPAYFPLAVPYRAGVWVPDPINGDLYWFDKRTQDLRDLPFPPGHLLVVEGSDAYTPDRLYLLDAASSRIEPLGNGRLATARSFSFPGGLPAEVVDPASSMLFASQMDGKSWVVAFGVAPGGGPANSVLVGLPVDRRDHAPPIVIGLPSGFAADALLADPQDDSLWIHSCYCDSPY